MLTRANSVLEPARTSARSDRMIEFTPNPKVGGFGTCDLRVMRRPLAGRNGVPAGKSLAKDSSPTVESRLRLQLVVGLDHLVVRGDYVQLWRDIFLGNEQLLPFVLP